MLDVALPILTFLLGLLAGLLVRRSVPPRSNGRPRPPVPPATGRLLVLLLLTACAASPLAVEAKAAGALAITLEKIRSDEGLAIVATAPSRPEADRELDALRAAWAPVTAAEDGYAKALGDPSATPAQVAASLLLIRQAYCAVRQARPPLPDFPLPALPCTLTLDAGTEDARDDR